MPDSARQQAAHHNRLLILSAFFLIAGLAGVGIIKYIDARYPPQQAERIITDASPGRDRVEITYSLARLLCIFSFLAGSVLGAIVNVRKAAPLPVAVLLLNVAGAAFYFSFLKG